MPRTVRILKPRVVKGRTAKQRAVADRFKQNGPTFTIPVSPGPATSWWAGVSRDELRERVNEQQRRIALSRFGRLSGSGVIGEY
jgi:hypothetical protein